MPTRRQLEEAGQKDLVKLIMDAGGFLDVAFSLGYRSARRPPGYWENEVNLDRELSMFVAANWIKFDSSLNLPEFSSTQMQEITNGNEKKDLMDSSSVLNSTYRTTYPHDETVYWYNQVSLLSLCLFVYLYVHRVGVMIFQILILIIWLYYLQICFYVSQVTRQISWEEPTLPEAVTLDDSGTEIFAESDENRAMPSRSIVQASGRYDLHAAIMAYGGYRAVAKHLGRRPSWPPSMVSPNKLHEKD